MNRDRGLRTRAALQEAAYRLFLEQGYEKTTVAQIAGAAGVSHMTFFRHFPTKEDVVLRDEYDPLLEELVRKRPTEEHPVQRIRNALMSVIPQVYEEEHDSLLLRTQLILGIPALRRRIGDSMRGSELAFERGLTPAGDDTPPLTVRAAAAACTAALAAAITTWAESDGAADLPTLIDEALGVLTGTGEAHDG